MNDKEILRILREEKPYLKDNFGLLSIGVFGSYAKGTARPDSDIDMIVELEEPCFDAIAGLQIYLEGRFGKPVEVIRKRKRLSERFLRRISETVQYA